MLSEQMVCDTIAAASNSMVPDDRGGGGGVRGRARARLSTATSARVHSELNQCRLTRRGDEVGHEGILCVAVALAVARHRSDTI